MNTFTQNIESFFRGIGYHVGETSGIGQHSGFIDTLAKYGIFGGLFLLVIFVKIYLYFKRILGSNKYWIQLSMIFFAFIIYGFFNNSIKPDICCIIFIITPLLPDLIEKKVDALKRNIGGINV
jgi:hypothetical protein